MMEKRDVMPSLGTETAPSAAHATTCTFYEQGRCVTCSDEAWPARVVRVDAESSLALVEIEVNVRAEIDITLVDGITPGDWLLIHGGVAIGKLDERADGGHENGRVVMNNESGNQG